MYNLDKDFKVGLKMFYIKITNISNSVTDKIRFIKEKVFTFELTEKPLKI